MSNNNNNSTHKLSIQWIEQSLGEFQWLRLLATKCSHCEWKYIIFKDKAIATSKVKKQRFVYGTGAGPNNCVQNVKGVPYSPTLLKEIDFLERSSHSRYGARVKTYLFDEYNTSQLKEMEKSYVQEKSDVKRKEVYKAAKVKAPPDDPNSYVIKYYLDGETKYYITRDFMAV
ncbi:hypothetical protein PPL_10807 [Heterostelium album PN500]|uniref:Uncharacterized protein n=1 Tax=Heterostelium pallidum (strain ATCC 26659 / Pp 5 / PN500) TaxID=670386 RepID=D3BS15_HETP5|nr:hypothetical protein PPL_10807 [Heterostelium album PN500]EFA75752.1 hypothetical protein PPL_10807 [Heterostelium album PN500]|eukprot:XP_020427886.1 hypothetical protein PPL_10807 [Heterostelium album PN500]